MLTSQGPISSGICQGVIPTIPPLGRGFLWKFVPPFHSQQDKFKARVFCQEEWIVTCSRGKCKIYQDAIIMPTDQMQNMFKNIRQP